MDVIFMFGCRIQVAWISCVPGVQSVELAVESIQMLMLVGIVSLSTVVVLIACALWVAEFRVQSLFEVVAALCYLQQCCLNAFCSSAFHCLPWITRSLNVIYSIFLLEGNLDGGIEVDLVILGNVQSVEILSAMLLWVSTTFTSN